MKKQLDLVKEFHNKFKVPVLSFPQIPDEKRFEFRHKLMDEEVDEYLKGCKEEDLINVAKELVDVLYSVYGTILEHGLQDVIEDVFEEVHKSQMSKDYSEFKMIKGESYFEADVKKFFEEK